MSICYCTNENDKVRMHDKGSECSEQDGFRVGGIVKIFGGMGGWGWLLRMMGERVKTM